MGIRIRNAHKLHGVGLLWGYNIFLNQRIRVELEPGGEPFVVSIEEVKNMIRTSSLRWRGWLTRPDFKEFRARLLSAATVRDVIQLLCAS